MVSMVSRGSMSSDKIFGGKTLFIGFMCLITLVLSGFFNACFAQTLTAACGAVSEVPSWPRNKMRMDCTLTISGLGGGDHSIMINPDSYNTTRNSGNGPNPLVVTSPEHRINGCVNATSSANCGTPATNLTTDTAYTTGVLLYTTAINGTYYSRIDYTTYEADTGGTNYTQNLTFRVFKNSSEAELTNDTDTLTFTVANKQYVSKTAHPTITLVGSSEVYSFDTFFSSNTITVNVKANNTWKLQAELLGVPTDAAKTIPITSTYFYIGSSANYVEIASTNAATPTQFAATSTYYDVASNNGGTFTTGTSDSINLDSIGVTFTYRLKNLSDWSDAYDQGNYSCTGRFKVISPN